MCSQLKNRLQLQRVSGSPFPESCRPLEVNGSIDQTLQLKLQRQPLKHLPPGVSMVQHCWKTGISPRPKALRKALSPGVYASLRWHHPCTAAGNTALDKC